MSQPHQAVPLPMGTYEPVDLSTLQFEKAPDTERYFRLRKAILERTNDPSWWYMPMTIAGNFVGEYWVTGPNSEYVIHGVGGGWMEKPGVQWYKLEVLSYGLPSVGGLIIAAGRNPDRDGWGVSFRYANMSLMGGKSTSLEFTTWEGGRIIDSVPILPCSFRLDEDLMVVSQSGEGDMAETDIISIPEKDLGKKEGAEDQGNVVVREDQRNEEEGKGKGNVVVRENQRNEEEGKGKGNMVVWDDQGDEEEGKGKGNEEEGEGYMVELVGILVDVTSFREESVRKLQDLSLSVSNAFDSRSIRKMVYGEYQNDGIPPEYELVELGQGGETGQEDHESTGELARRRELSLNRLRGWNESIESYGERMYSLLEELLPLKDLW